jgi:REP element-mobilizing transposase RayT
VIIASHVILSAYGFWLPNDPRGSWSDFVRSWELFRHGGPATPVNDRRSHASAPHDRIARLRAKEGLKYPPVTFDGLQARAVARGFADAVGRTNAIVRACAILKDHVHMVILRHRYPFKRLVTQLKGGATRQLLAEGLHPLARCRTTSGTLPSPWAQLGWTVFIDDAAHLHAAIEYVRNNPVKEGPKAQKWNFCREVKVC